MVERDRSQLIPLPEEAIELSFISDGMEIIALNNELFNNRVERDALVFGKVKINKNGEKILSPLTPEENKKAYHSYLETIKLFGGNK